MVEKTQERQAHPTPHQAFLAPRLHILPAIILQRYNIHHLVSTIDDPVLIIMDLPHGDLTNVQSPSVAVHDEDVHQDVPGAHRGIAPAPEAQLVHRYESPRKDRERSITLRSASPPRRGDRQPVEEYHQPHDYSSNTPTLQASSWWKSQHSTGYNNPTDDSYHPEQSSSNKWQSWGKWKNYSKNPSSMHQSTWDDPKKPSNRYTTSSHDSATKPLTAFSTSKSAPPRHKKSKPDTSGDDQSKISVSIPTGHMLINLRDGSKAEWIRAVKFGLRHKDRMKAASEIPYADQPQPNKTVNIEDFQRAVATLQRIDSRIPSEVTRKAIHLISSTNLLPVFDLEQSFIIDLPSTNMLALILPLPAISRFTMPPPFKDTQNHTWALLHGTPIETAQAILLEGKIRPANGSFNNNLSRCDMPTFGSFYLGREIAKSDTFPEWAAKDLMDTIQKKGKGQQEVIVGQCIEVHALTLLLKLEAMKVHRFQ